MKRILFAAAGLLVLSLSGCLDGGSDPDATGETTLAAPDCEAQGLELGINATTGETECVEPAPPARVDVLGLPDSVETRTVVDFTWVLHTDAQQSHTMRTEVRFSTESIADEELGGPDDWGESAAMREHQNFVDGQSYDGTWIPDAPGTYYFRAYAVVDATHVWGPEHTVAAVEPGPTGVTHAVTVTACGVPGVGGLEPADLAIARGDAVSWTSGDPDTYAITSTNGPADFSTATGGDAVTFMVPGSYTYEAIGTLETACTGSIEVTA